MSDPGYFPSGSSILRRVHDERAVGLFYGQRALMIGALDARNYVGTAEHTAERRRPFLRLVRTAKAFETIFFGTRQEADQVLDRVARLHRRVEGTLAEQTGPWPAGTPYSAFEPELMLWTMAVMADSAAYFYELLVGPLSDPEYDDYWSDYVRFAELFGMPVEAAPGSWGEFRAWFDARLAGPEMFLTEEATYVGCGVATAIPLPQRHRVAMPLHNLIMLGSLPERARQLYGIDWNRARQLSFALVTRALRIGRPLSPDFVARGYNTDSFEMVASTEQRLTAAGRPPLPELHA